MSRMDTVLDARSVGDACPRGRKVSWNGMMLTASRDEICGATMIAVSSAGHTGQGLAAVMPDSIVSLPSSG